MAMFQFAQWLELKGNREHYLKNSWQCRKDLDLNLPRIMSLKLCLRTFLDYLQPEAQEDIYYESGFTLAINRADWIRWFGTSAYPIEHKHPQMKYFPLASINFETLFLRVWVMFEATNG